VELLEASLRSVVERHEVLRTTFAIRDGLPVLRIASEALLKVPLRECPDIPESERDAMARRLAVVEAQPSFEFSRDLPIRARLVRFAADDHLLLITVHHIASDGWSKAVLFRELELFYAAGLNGREPDLPPLPIQYVDFAAWLRTHMEGEHGEKLLAYWKDRLAGAPALLELPTDRPRPARQTFEGALQRMELSVALAGAIRSVGRAESATLYMTLLAAFQALLARYSGATDLCVGTPIAHRLRPETEPLIGYFVNTLVMRTSLSGDPTFRELLARVRETALGAYDHQDLPLDMLIEALQPARSLSYGPVFQVLFQLRNFPEIVTRLEGLDVSAVAYDPGTAQFDLSLDITEVENGLTCVLNYNVALFDASTARSMLGHYGTLLEGIVRNPDAHISQLPLLTAVEQQELLVERNRTAVYYPRSPAIRLFEQQVARSPDAIAASDESRRWTYAELDSHAAAVAHRLRLAGVKTGDLVAIGVDRSVEMLGALLGIWKAGAAYVPLDLAYPPERLAYILQDSNAKALLTEANLRGSFAQVQLPVILLEDCRDQLREPDSPSEASDDGIAYVLYTSGSTGKPKGVAIRHRSVTNLLLAMQQRLEFSDHETQLAITTIAFDISVAELFVPLISGARVVIASREVAADANLLARAIDESGATIVQATPSAWQMLFDTGWTGPRCVSGGGSLKIMCTGEACPEALGQRLAAIGRAWNGYGPTETTVWSTVAELRSGAPVTIGTPVANTRVYVLDANLQPVPAFVPGELYIGGAGVAAGYWRREDLTEERFVHDPFGDSGERMYRTGDLVRWLSVGELRFLGRIDTQVKLRGFRIELGEIESVLREHPAVRSAATRLVEAGAGDMRLAAFYTLQPGSDISDGQLREFLRAKLPDYMVPGFLVALSEFPLTPNGKIERAALCLPAQSERAAPLTSPASQDMTEVTLLAIWQQVLRSGPIGVDDDFFALGGHSLLGARLLARVERAFGVKLTLSTFFEAPTVAQMAVLLRSKPSSGESRVFPIRAGDQPPFYILHADPVFRPLALALPGGRAISGVSLPAAADVPQTLEQIASHEVDVLLEAQPEGPFAIGGWCVDGVLALEISQQIRARRGVAPLLVMFDSFNPAHLRHAGVLKSTTMKSAAAAHRLGFHAAKISRLGPRAVATYILDTWRWRRKRRTLISAPQDSPPVSPIHFAASRYDPRPYDGPAILFRALDRPGGVYKDSAAGWSQLIPQLEVVDVPGNHIEMLNEPGVRIIAAQIVSKVEECVERAGYLSRS
jgi:amino acid adenylation domain-containing protein